MNFVWDIRGAQCTGHNHNAKLQFDQQIIVSVTVFQLSSGG